MATIFVTGGAGYVGSHACKALARAGHLPVTYDSLERGHRALVKWGPLEVGDIHDRAALSAAFDRHRPDAVMHFASYIFVDESVGAPGMYRRNIVDGTRSLLEAMEAQKISRLVVSSSCAVYGLPTTIPIDETAPCTPVNPYGEAKLAMERLLADAERRAGLAWSALRYFNAAGADPDGQTGEWHDPEPHLIPRVLDVAGGRANGLVVNGTDYPTADGTCVRDYVHVTDLADAHLLALAHVTQTAGGHIFNLGSERGYSVQEVIAAVREVTQQPVPITTGPRRAGDPPILVADSRRARHTLGWRPQRTAITTQISDAWAWHKQLHHL